MSLDLPYILLFAMAAAGLIVWLFALRYLLKTQGGVNPPPEMWEDDEALPSEPGTATVRGGAEVAGRPADLSAKAAAHLAQHGIGMIGLVRILDKNERRIVFETMPNVAGGFTGSGVLSFQPQGSDRTQIDYAIRIPRRQGLLAAAWIVQIIGIVVLSGLFVTLYLWVAPNPNPGVRWQSVQMVQAIHFLWPPFLLAGLYRRMERQVRTTFDSMVSNLPYLQ